MFSQSVRYYDAIYSFKHYAGEATRLHALLQAAGCPDGAALLDVACGTGKHDEVLKAYYRLEGLDISLEMVAIARRRNPEVTYYVADMVDFALPGRYSAIVCLFSSIGYLRTIEQMNTAVQNMGRHLEPGGVLVIEPWLAPQVYRTGTLGAHFVDQPDLKIARFSFNGLEGRCAVIDMHHMVATLEGVQTFVERHQLMLFTHEEYLSAFRAAGLAVTFDEQGLTGRGLYTGIRA